ncbi:MAG: phosphopantothenoylcysteine decarboxylase [Planctomycetes bacterium]|nr:phosphopantothenoylcysteine decarboxylase [Planctomycetota bacterium]
MANVLLGVTGSVAAIHTPELFRALKQAGYQVKVVATDAACYFFDPAAIEPLSGKRNPDIVILDEDEWPGQERGRFYQRSDPVLHIELRRWADVLVIAPLDANTLAKLAHGMADNCLTCVARAWDRTRPMILAPAMNTLMWEHPATLRQLCLLAADHNPHPARCELVFLDSRPVEAGDLPGFVDWMNTECASLHILYPQTKKLACDDVGVGAMADRDSVVEIVRAKLQRK